MPSSSGPGRFTANPDVGAQKMKISVVYSLAPREVKQWAVELPEGSRLAQALESCGIFSVFPELAGGFPVMGLWGKRALSGHVLQDGDRVEVYRPLKVDPKIARRKRFNRQGAKRAGLFATIRAGAKAGY
jgi:putative ubiquitin-RnfH superfamily antitoxin RatB of RatAB toxin-antitoxin module